MTIEPSLKINNKVGIPRRTCRLKEEETEPFQSGHDPAPWR